MWIIQKTLPKTATVDRWITRRVLDRNFQPSTQVTLTLQYSLLHRMTRPKNMNAMSKYNSVQYVVLNFFDSSAINTF